MYKIREVLICPKSRSATELERGIPGRKSWQLPMVTPGSFEWLSRAGRRTAIGKDDPSKEASARSMWVLNPPLKNLDSLHQFVGNLRFLRKGEILSVLHFIQLSPAVAGRMNQKVAKMGQGYKLRDSQ